MWDQSSTEILGWDKPNMSLFRFYHCCRWWMSQCVVCLLASTYRGYKIKSPHLQVGFCFSLKHGWTWDQCPPPPPTTTTHHYLYSTCTPWLNPDFKCHSQNGRKPWKVIIWHPVFLSCITTFYLKDILRNKYFFKCCLIYWLLLYLYTQAFLGCLTFLLFFFLCFVPNLWLNCQHLDFVSFEGGFFLILLTPLCHDPTHI